jgi:hypothetical protein
MYDTVKALIAESQEKSGNMCGTSIPKICASANLNIEELNPILRTLYDEKFIKTRKGINGTLIFLTKTTKTK